MLLLRDCLRWLARAALLLLTAITLATLLAWPVSYRWAWCNMIRGDAWALSADIYSGGVSVCLVTGAVRSAHDEPWASSLEDVSQERAAWDLPGTWAGFDFEQRDVPVARVPLWFVALAAGAPPAAWVLRRWRKRHKPEPAAFPLANATPWRCEQLFRAVPLQPCSLQHKEQPCERGSRRPPSDS